MVRKASQQQRQREVVLGRDQMDGGGKSRQRVVWIEEGWSDRDKEIWRGEKTGRSGTGSGSF